MVENANYEKTITTFYHVLYKINDWKLIIRIESLVLLFHLGKNGITEAHIFAWPYSVRFGYSIHSPNERAKLTVNS